jgi:competence protein ComEC
MRTGIVLLATGVLLLAYLPRAPDAAYVAFLPLFVLAAWLHPPARVPALIACGFLWALLRAHCLLGAQLPAELEGSALVVEGTVAGLPRADPHRVRFDFDVAAARRDGRIISLQGRLRLSWYDGAPMVLPGERWQLAVRLKRPRGLVNPGGMDHERWLFIRGIAATGYVLSRAGNRHVGPDGATGLDGLRRRLSSAIGKRLAGRDSGAIVRALAVGDRSAMTREQWRILRATGTNHLMAISGLHVGLMAGLAWFIVARLWAAAAMPLRWLAAPRAAALAALMAGLVYAALAGFTLPTQRALVMLTIVMGALLLQRRTAPSTSLCLALGAVLVLDPFAVLAAGFWLSYGAVAVILLGMCGRLRYGSRHRWRRLWWRWGRVQWLVAVGLAPATVGWFLEYPIIAPLANLVAVPWAGVVLVPLVLGGAGLVVIAPATGGALLDAAGWAADAMWLWLETLAGLELILRPALAPPPLAVAAACIGALLLIAPRGFPARFLGVIWLLPLFSLPVPRPQPGDIRLTVLDVGQGLSAVVRTRSRVVVFDTGPRYRSGFDAGRDIVAPYLRHQGLGRVDLLIVSHGHNDHAGGAGHLLRTVPVSEVMSNVPMAGRDTRPCRAGDRWHWDGVEFEVLHPGEGDPLEGNDGSCVLMVSGAGGRLLLPGDIEKQAESAMVSRDGTRLGADVLVVAHHGGRSSSTAAFLDAVGPRLALLPVGYRNRHGFPHGEVVARLAERGVRTFDTARDGALTLVIDARRGVQLPRRERVADAHLWRSGDASAAPR